MDIELERDVSTRNRSLEDSTTWPTESRDSVGHVVESCDHLRGSPLATDL